MTQSVLTARRWVGLWMCMIPLLVGASPSPRLSGSDLLPAPAFDAGNHVPTRKGWALNEGRAETFRNVAEIIPTRRVATSDTAYPLKRAAKPLSLSYAFGGAQHSIEEFVRRTETTGLLILKGDVILYEGYYLGADDKDTFQSFSAGKSFVSTLVALARADGKIKNFEEPISQYLPELKGSAYEHAKIRDVLQMASGTSYREEYENPDSDIAEFARITDVNEGGLYDFARSFKSIRPPGTKFYYASADTEILGVLVSRVTGQSLSAYMSERLWKPLGAEAPARWAIDAPGSRGREIAAGALQVTLRDYGRFGLLYARDGKVGDRRLLPAGWVAEATIPSAPYVDYGKLDSGDASDDPSGYGYQWWCIPDAHHSFSAEGIHGQFVMVDPVTQIVVVKLSAWSHAWDDPMAEETMAFFEAVVTGIQ